MGSPVTGSDFDVSNLAGNVCEILEKENQNNNLFKTWFSWAFTPDGSAFTPEFVAMLANVIFPVGAITFWPLASVPANYVRADGRSLLRAHSAVGAMDGYPELFAVYGTTYGTEDATHFNVRNLKDQFLLGAGDKHSVGETGGEETHKLVEAELPTVNPAIDFSPAVKAVYPPNLLMSVTSYDGSFAGDDDPSGKPLSNFSQYGTGLVVLPFGDDAPHNNMPPYATGTWVIKAR